MKAILTIFILFVSTFSYAQTFDWKYNIGGTGQDQLSNIAYDSDNNIYVVGHYYNTVDFDPNPISTQSNTSNGQSDGFLAKYDSSGNLVWYKSFGGTNYDLFNAVCVDHLGNIIVSGQFSGTADIDPNAGSVTYTATSYYDDFLLKLDPNGETVWIKLTDAAISHIKTDANNNIYYGGSFQGTCDFDPSNGVFNLTSNGNDDIFISKLNSNGNLLWAESFGGTQSENFGYQFEMDNAGSIYMVGYFFQTVDFDPGPGVQNLTAAGSSNNDNFILKLNNNGSFNFVKRITGPNSENGGCIAVDHNKNIYIGGTQFGSVDFDPDPDSVYTLPYVGSGDAYIVKLDSVGTFKWAKGYASGSYTEDVRAIKMDDLGIIYLTGVFSQLVDFDPGTGVHNLPANSGSGANAYILKLNNQGQFLSANGFYNSNTDINPSLLLLDNDRNLYCSGYFSGSFDADPSASGNQPTTSNGGHDGFIVKFHQCATVSSIQSVTACDSYTWQDSITYISSTNNATTVLSNANGCDSLIHLHLTVNYSTQDTTVNAISVCDSLVWMDGITYYSSTNIPLWTLPNSHGCDSIIRLNLNVLNSSYNTDYQNACDSLTWMDGITYYTSTNTPTWTIPNSIGCDSVITLNLVILSNSGVDFQTACDSLTWIDGITYYTSTNTPTWTIPNSAGCDSVVTLNLALLSNSGIDFQTVCDSLTWIDGITYYASTNTPTWALPNAAGCDSVVTLNLTIIPSVPTVIENSFSMPSDPNSCVGEIAVTISGNTDFELNIDGLQTATSNGYSLFTDLCPGIHDLQIINFCGDTTLTQFVIPIDSNYVFNNPFIDSLAQDSLGVTLTDCDIYYAGIDTAYIDSVWANGNTVNVIWNIVDSNGSNFDTTSYILNNGNGVYWLQLSVFCPTKAIGDYFAVTEAIYFDNGNVSSAGISELTDDNFVLYPNPTNDLVTISFEGNNANYTIYDAQGKLIQNSKIISGGAVSLKDVQTGVYFFELTTENGSVVKRVIKN